MLYFSSTKIEIWRALLTKLFSSNLFYSHYGDYSFNLTISKISKSYADVRYGFREYYTKSLQY